MEKLFKKIFIEGTLECLTGLHIGDSKDNIDIGGVDGPVVRRKDNNQPYIPGSSIKGKMRCLLQQIEGEEGYKIKVQESPITKLFGGEEEKNKTKSHASRLIVRDAYLSVDSEKMLAESKFTDMPYTEQKFENTIDRITGTTRQGGVRNQERVPAGAIFDIKFVINVLGNTEEEAKTNENELLNTFYKGVDLINDDYLGGSGSRGYGHVKINVAVKGEKTASEYLSI